MPNRKKTGRKKTDVSPRVVQAMASVGATDQEIADFCGCAASTITSRFRGILTKARINMRTKLRRAQYKLALSGNATMQIWLGKQILGQHEPVAESKAEISGKDGGPIGFTLSLGAASKIAMSDE